MKGVSVLTAAAIMADIVSVDRFTNSKHFMSYLRIAPRVESINEKAIIKDTNNAGR
jgi:transposase